MPGCMRRSCVSLKLATTQRRSRSGATAISCVAGVTCWPSSRGAIAGDAVERRADHGVGEVVLGKLRPRPRHSAGAPGLDHLRVQHLELLFGRDLLRLGGNHRGVGLALVGDRLVVGLARRPATSHQRSGSGGIGSWRAPARPAPGRWRPEPHRSWPAVGRPAAAPSRSRRWPRRRRRRPERDGRASRPDPARSADRRHARAGCRRP